MLAHSEFTTADRNQSRSRIGVCLAAFLLCIGLSHEASAQRSDVLGAGASARAVGPHATVTLRLPEVFLADGDDSKNVGSEIAVEFVLQPDWHIYWLNPGDSGEEPKFQFAKSENIEIGSAIFPTPSRIPAGPFTNFGFSSSENPVAIRFPVRVAPTSGPAGRSADVVLNLSYLVCKEECVPAEAVLAASAPIRTSDDIGKSTLEYDAYKYPIHKGVGSLDLPIESSWQLLSGSQPESIGLRVPNASEKEFFPLTANQKSSAPIFVAGDGGRPLAGQLAVALDPSGELKSDEIFVGLLVDKKSREATWIRFEKENSVDWLGLLKALFLACLGGILLNLMPCVFPVVSLKIMSFVNESRGNSRETKVHALLYAAGILLSLWVLVGVLLGLRAAGSAIGWGFQLQSPAFLFLLYGVFLFLGFNLLGLFEINYAGPSFLQNALASRGRLGSSFTGLLTTIVATPCSAPFMGVAIGAALAAGPLESVLVFTALGIGLAIPYVILGFFPRLVSFLPRPGIWMERLKQGLAFPLFMTAVWLLWVLSQTSESASLIVILVWTVIASLFVWALHYRLRWMTKVSALLFLVASLATSLATIRFADFSAVNGVSHTAENVKSMQWQTFSDRAVSDARAAGNAVFVDFTASWCVTCQINKTLVLDTDRGRQIFASRNISLFRADWTKRDKEISNALSRLGRSSVPVYAFYGKGKNLGDESSVKLLPEILTFDSLEAALDGVYK
ncbi:MAG: thioredoxin family protein [Deltaproteobacteria bacterium]|nr:thioredoxin family protein [Deltaproteobacteria bacterium]